MCFLCVQGKTRHRVVTLQGQLVDQSGTMSGGGGRVVKGRMSSKAVSDVTPQQVEELTKRLADNERAAEVSVGRRGREKGGEEREGERRRKEVKGRKGGEVKSAEVIGGGGERGTATAFLPPSRSVVSADEGWSNTLRS